jgi:hypothetical protein
MTRVIHSASDNAASPMPKRGRPRKFGRPSRVVALTLPEEVVSGLRKIHPDLAWAIVTLFEKQPLRGVPAPEPRANAELVTVGVRQALIVVNRTVFKHLPGIDIIPLSDDRAFLALAPGRGMTDLELAVLDRIEDGTADRHERRALNELRAQLRRWRLDAGLRFHTRAIIVVERAPKRRGRPERAGGDDALPEGQVPVVRRPART